MFGLLHTGDSYQSQTEHLVHCTQTYLKLCYGNARDIFELAKENRELISFWAKNRERSQESRSNLEKQKNAEKVEDQIQEYYRELIIHSCTTKLYASFSLESFINAFATFLTNRKILVSVQDEAKETILHYISRLYDKMSTLDKWEEVAAQFGSTQLNKRTILWKKFCELYRFRDSAVHDKPIFIRRTGDVVQIKRGVIRQVKVESKETSAIARYINDAYQACKTHDDMIRKLYTITGVKEEEGNTQFYVLPNNYHRRIKTVVKKLEELEQQIKAGY
ncbi:MAG: hypothetical protein ACOYI2_01835 [Bacillota bacterium]